ncbi:MAG: WYL domain-containing protein [Treponema sp.]|nr:WYL domain-containing protein [Treponema sp.]
MERQIKINNWRIVKIDELLQSGRWYTAKEIAKSIEDGSYSSRTIQRDIEYMRDTLNAPIESDSRGYHYTEKNFFIKSIPLTEGEALSVAILNPLLEQYRNTPLENQLRSVFQKITNCLPDRITVDTSFLNPRITFIPDRIENIKPELFTTIFDAIKKGVSISFDYRPLQKPSFMERTIDPYHAVCQRGNWYVIGKCHDKEDVRIFSFGRMKNAVMTTEKFSIPKDFKTSDYFDSEMGVWLSDKIPLEVELLFDKEIATYATNRIWHSDQTLEEREDGSVYLKFKTTQKKELLRFILGQGHTVKVLGPMELVEEVKEELQRTEMMYR